MGQSRFHYASILDQVRTLPATKHLPRLDGTSVSIDGQPAFVSYISPAQVNVQIPSTVSAGPKALQSATAAGTSSSYAINVSSTEPGLLAPSVFIIGGCSIRCGTLLRWFDLCPAVQRNRRRHVKTGQSRRNDHPLWVGFGNVNPSRSTRGRLFNRPTTLTLPLQIFFNQMPGTLTYAGLAPDEVGLYQFNVVVPSGLQARYGSDDVYSRRSPRQSGSVHRHFKLSRPRPYLRCRHNSSQIARNPPGQPRPSSRNLIREVLASPKTFSRIGGGVSCVVFQYSAICRDSCSRPGVQCIAFSDGLRSQQRARA